MASSSGNSQNEFTAAVRFQKNCIKMSSDVFTLIDRAFKRGETGTDPRLLQAAQLFFLNYDKMYNINKLPENFIYYSYPYWDIIHSRDEEFFIKHAGSVFGEIPLKANQLNAFKDLFTKKGTDGKPIINEDEKEDLWAYFVAFVKISIKDTIEKRHKNPKHLQFIERDEDDPQCGTGKKVKKTYEINLEKYVKIFNVKLE
jgi:hypothetical protein